MKIAQFRFELEDKSPLILTYNLQDNSLTPKWIHVVNERKKETKQSTLTQFITGNSFPTEPLELKIQNKTSDDLPTLMEKLNSIIIEINKYYDQPLPLFTNTKELDHTILNYLHEQFELYGGRHAVLSKEGYGNQVGDPNIFPGTEFNVQFHQLWLDLNQWIHITEGAMDNQEFPHFSCLIQYTPFVEQGMPIEKEDKLFLEHTAKWGHLYLGYNTLGKDYVHAFWDDDKRVITNDQVRVQKWLSSEVWLDFSKDVPSTVPYKSFELQFYKWWRTLNEKERVPFVDISELALGRYFIGEVSFDKAFLDFHPVYEDWLVPNSEIRKNWSIEVFGKIVKVTGIKILDV
jgi:hypothetical protein